MNRFMSIAVGVLALGAAREVSAECRLIINVDLTSSMNSLRADGTSKCFVGQNSALLVLEAYRNGKDFDVTQPMMGFIDRPEYDANCPNQADRLVQVWTFQGTTVAPLFPDFLPVEEGYAAAVTSGLIVDPLTLLPTDSCPGPSTPMAQSMCRVAFKFSAVATPPAAGTTRVVKTITDGGENSSTSFPLLAGEPDCRDGDDTEEDWRNKVKLEYLARGIIADAILWEVGGGSGLMSKLMKTAPVSVEHGTAPLQKGDVAPAITGELRAADDAAFFSQMAAQVSGGRYRNVPNNLVISPYTTLLDGDNDGVPDFRDSCIGRCANDSDGDQIPSPTDQCSTAVEDARGLLKLDGCPDTDSDGLRNGLDLCPTIAEDGRVPFKTDGCKAANFNTAGPTNVAIPNNATVCSTLTMATRSDSALAKLNVAGSYTQRQGLSATLAHNGTTVAAFPAGTFVTGNGNFALTNRVVSGLSGDTQGAWTLCVTDSSTQVSSGTLSSWSVHN